MFKYIWPANTHLILIDDNSGLLWIIHIIQLNTTYLSLTYYHYFCITRALWPRFNLHRKFSKGFISGAFISFFSLYLLYQFGTIDSRELNERSALIVCKCNENWDKFISILSWRNEPEVVVDNTWFKVLGWNVAVRCGVKKLTHKWKWRTGYR